MAATFPHYWFEITHLGAAGLSLPVAALTGAGLWREGKKSAALAWLAAWATAIAVVRASKITEIGRLMHAIKVMANNVSSIVTMWKNRIPLKVSHGINALLVCEFSAILLAPLGERLHLICISYNGAGVAFEAQANGSEADRVAAPIKQSNPEALLQSLYHE